MLRNVTINSLPQTKEMVKQIMDKGSGKGNRHRTLEEIWILGKVGRKEIESWRRSWVRLRKAKGA